MSKKQIIGVLIIVVALLFAGCSEETAQTTSEGADTASTAETASTIAEAATQTTEGNAETTEQTTQETESGMDIISDEKSETSAAMESTMMSDSEESSSSETTSTENTMKTHMNEMMTTSNVEEYTVKAFRYGYQPDTLTVKKGDLVKITIENEDGTHGMRLQDFGVEDMEYIEFTPDKTGTFTWYCNNFCGSGHSSMSGTLIVEE